jgi:hypothetical protein
MNALKRTLAFVFGALSLAACVYAGGGTLLIAHEYLRDGGPIWQLLVAAIPAAVCLAAGWLGSRLVQFAVTGNSAPMGMMGDVLMGLCCFFPGFVFSLLLVMFVVARFLPSTNGAEIVAFGFSIAVGLVCAVAGVVYFTRKRKAGPRNPPFPANSTSGPETTHESS